MPKFSRDKGKRFEQDAAKAMRAIGYPGARRHLEYQDGEAYGVDLENVGSWRIQCKSTAQTPNLPRVFAEFTRLKDGEVPVVFARVTGKGGYAVFRLDDALRLMRGG